MNANTVDLSSYLNQSVVRGHPADFPTAIRPVTYLEPSGSLREIPNRLAVVREDTGEALAIVSDRYTFVPHQRILDVMEEAIAGLDCGPVPRGIYVDRRGARMRAVFKFPSMARELQRGDEVCPCVQVANTYDGTSRLHVSIGAFRFVCTNLAVGGGGVFAGGFMAVHAGDIPVETVGQQLTEYLSRFSRIVETYRFWIDAPCPDDLLREALSGIRPFHLKRLWQRIGYPPGTVFGAYNAATAYATRETRSPAVAFALLQSVNRGFQQQFPIL